MKPRSFLILCFSLLGVAALAAVGIAVWLVDRNLPDPAGAELARIIMVFGGAAAFALTALIAVLWAYLDHALVQPLTAIVKGIETVVHANTDYRIEIDEVHQLGGLPGAVNELIRELGLARGSVTAAIETATERLEQQKSQLATILQDLHEGVIVCTLNHRILLYNKRALELLRIGGDIGLDRSLFHFLTAQPILHALTRLSGRLSTREGTRPAGTAADDHLPDRPTVAFVGSTTDGRHMLEGRMSLMLDQRKTSAGYVLSFEDDTEELAALGLRDRLLREATEGLRAPVANLRAAAEILVSTPQLSADEQSPFKQVLLQESEHVCDRLETLAAQYRDVITGHWPMSDIYSANLFQTLADRLREQRDVTATVVGIAQWLHGDSYSLVELLERLIVRLSGSAATAAFDLEAIGGEKLVYLDVVWSGAVLSAAELSGWLDEQLEDALGGLSLREILERHKTDIWSLSERPGQARLRLPLPPPAHPQAAAAVPGTPARPEFYDFGLLRRPLDLGDLGRRPLKALTYVVFDTETTGLEPSGGDEIVSIAGVRIVNGRLLTGECFERMVNPRRPIPADSIRFHGITDEMIRDKPPIEVVLPQFRRFVGEAVLVAHNAAFDLKFLKLREADAGVSFEMPVLDTLLLSCFLHDHTARHNLDMVAERFGIPIQGRHTALGDSLVTAGCFLRMLDMLEAHGVTNLDQALAASEKIVQVKARQASF